MQQTCVRLVEIAADRNSPQKHVWRTQIVLLSADGVGTSEIMRVTGTSKTCVWRWQQRFMEAGVDGLLVDKTRPSRIPPLADAVTERVVALTLTEPPGETTHWTAAAVATACSISVSSVHRIWRSHGLRPHQIRQFKLSNDPQFAAKVRDIVGLYVNPPEHAVVLSVDEKSQIQALDRTQLPLKKGRNADIALYSAKKLGRGRFQLFEASMEAAMRARSELEQDLAQAVVAETLSLYYQPIYNQDATAITSYEALLRWHHPKHGWIPPSIFIPIAEESRVILPLGRWTLTNACKAAALWDRPHGIAVNLSPVQVLDGSLIGLVAEALSESGLDPGRLTLEVTEGVLMRDVTAAQSVLETVKAQGVRLALDDFGTGYSSLSYLSQFPFDTLKIDRSFIQSLDVEPGAKPIVQAIVAMGHSLNLSITAEGVETASQLNLLRKMGCNNFQGYLFGQPSLLPTEAVL